MEGRWGGVLDGKGDQVHFFALPDGHRSEIQDIGGRRRGGVEDVGEGLGGAAHPEQEAVLKATAVQSPLRRW